MGSTPRGNLLSRVSHMGSFANWDSHAGPPTWAPSRVGSFPHMGSLTCDPSQMGSRTHMGTARVGTFPPGIPHMGSFSKKGGALPQDSCSHGISTSHGISMGSSHGIHLTWDLPNVESYQGGIITCGASHMGPPTRGFLQWVLLAPHNPGSPRGAPRTRISRWNPCI